MSSSEVCGIVEKGILMWYPNTQVITIPVADGGEGMVEAYLKGAGMVITGEGKIDGQTACGKVPAGVAMRAKAQGVPVVALAGDLGEGFEKMYDLGITAVFSTSKAAVPFEIAAQTCREDLALLVDSLMRFWSIGCKDTV